MSDSGTYECVAENKRGSAYSEPISVQVVGMYKIMNSLSASGDFCCLLISIANSLDPDQAPRLSIFFMLNSNEHQISTAHKKLKYRQIKKFLALSLSDVVFIMLISVKMPTIVGILTFMSRINFVLS